LFDAYSKEKNRNEYYYLEEILHIGEDYFGESFPLHQLMPLEKKNENINIPIASPFKK
jgi:hypothetical protein